MDIQSLYYFSELAKDLHMTRTANRLFISQQTLSNHIMRLEEYYGTPLLNRKPSLSLTYAGEQVLKYAQSINRSDQNLKDILHDIRQEKRGLIRFGASTLRMSVSLPEVLSHFSQEYPEVEIRITDAKSLQLEKLILHGDLDLAIVVSGDNNPYIANTHLFSDQIYLCVSDTLLEKYYGPAAEHLKQQSRQGADLKNFSRLPFCILKNRMGTAIQHCFNDAGYTPRIFTTSSYIQIATALGLKGIAACFATRSSLLTQTQSASDTINVFPLFSQNALLCQEISIIHHQDRYLSNYIKRFLELYADYFRSKEQLPIEMLIHQQPNSSR